MKIILSDQKLKLDLDIEGVSSKEITLKTMGAYEHNDEVVAIVGSRAMAIQCADMDFPSLRFFQLMSAGFDGVPVEKFKQKSVVVSNAANVYGIPIAETIIFGMLEIAKRIHVNPENRFPRITRGYENYITELYEKNVVILGMGNIGTELAKRLTGFGMHITGYARHKRENPWVKMVVTNKEELFALLNKADYVVSTLPDNEDSRGFISEEFFSAMKKSAYFINVGRRKTINEEALYRALKEREIQGAALDMFEKLPNPVTNKFRRLNNVIVWPGLTAISRETNDRLRKVVVRNLSDANII